MESPEPCSVPWIYRRTRHPVFAWLGLRPIFAQHTSAEHETLKRWACGRRRLVEIGVAEGASALALREAMSSDAVLYLIDPFHLSRIQWINATRDRKSTRLNSSHITISYAVFCLKKKKKKK